MTEESRVLVLAFRAALAARRETFLARYPRKLKLALASLPLLAALTFIAHAPGEPSWHIDVPKEHAASEETSNAHVASAPPSLAEAALRDALDRTKKDTPAPSSPPLIETPVLAPSSTKEAKDAIARNDDYGSKNSMLPAPEAAVVEKTAFGSLPAVARDGREPWEVYARPFDPADPRPRIALVVTDLGLSRIATDAAMHKLPGPVTMAFDVHGGAVNDWLERARSDGHEILLSLPMEPADYPRDDPGPNALLVGLSNADNLGRLLNFLTLGSGYIGVTSLSGSRFLNDPAKLAPVLDALKNRGLAVLSAEPSRYDLLATMAKEKGVPFSTVSVVVDSAPSPEKIASALERVEKTARLKGSAVALASPLPLTLDMLQPWLDGLKDKGFALAPLSSVVVTTAARQGEAAHGP